MAPESAWTAAASHRIELAAAHWLVKLQDPDLSVEETLAWQDWLSADPRHAAAFARLEEISVAARALSNRIPPPSQPHVVRSHAFARVPRLLALSAALLATFAAAVLGFESERGPLPESAAQVLSTAIAQNETFVLDDGSHVTLGGSSRLSVKMSPGSRDLDLQSGEAYFVVAKDPDRPFRVNAGDARVTAVGTQFDVRRENDRDVVVVTEGRVLVEPVRHLLPVRILRAFEPKLRPIRLPAGEQTLAGASGIDMPSKIADAAAATSWQSGRLAFHLEPLKYVIQDVNRYSSRPIVLADQDTGDLIVTGTLTIDNIPGWIDSLQRAFDLEATQRGDHIVLSRR